MRIYYLALKPTYLIEVTLSVTRTQKENCSNEKSRGLVQTTQTVLDLYFTVLLANFKLRSAIES